MIAMSTIVTNNFLLEMLMPLARFEPTTLATPPSTTPDIDATNYATETSPKKECSSSTDNDDG